LSGKLARGPCEKCGASDVKVHAHHDDYGEPLKVRWFCVPCHRLHHTGGKRKPPRAPRPVHPSRYHITKAVRGWVKRIDGKATWICSDKIVASHAAADAYYEKHFLKR
jgi:hypothetical protein